MPINSTTLSLSPYYFNGICGTWVAFRPISFLLQANYYFDTFNSTIHRHRLFIFILLNIHQRHTGHLQTYFTVNKPNFSEVAEELVRISPAVLTKVACHLENERSPAELSQEGKQALNLLRRVNTIAAHIPGFFTATRNSMQMLYVFTTIYLRSQKWLISRCPSRWSNKWSLSLPSECHTARRLNCSHNGRLLLHACRSSNIMCWFTLVWLHLY